jgi:23S rRNA (adenine2030-N6)-methyltransferase
MNYRHAFHAGGFADVIKHIVLVRMLTYLQEKPAAVSRHRHPCRRRRLRSHRRRGAPRRRMADRHRAGDAGAVLGKNALPLVTPYLDIVRAFNPPGELKAYPGSPLIARALLRPQDRLTACEIEPKARKR